MVNWLVGFLLLVAGFITSLFLARDALNFQVIQMVVAVLLFGIFVFVLAFWPTIKSIFKRKKP